jgi:hypothetical protein
MSKNFTFPFTPICDNGAAPMDLSTLGSSMSIYAQDTVQRFIPGTRYITWDGRVFKYAKSGAALFTGEAAFFGDEEKVTYVAVAAAQNAGDTQVTVASQSFAKDVLAGGYAIIFGVDNSDVQNRGIVGNNYCSSSTLIIDLDGPLYTALTVAVNAIEVCGNPYIDILYSGSPNRSVAGLPVVEVTAASKFFWLQTWGICWIAPGVAITGNTQRQFVFAGSDGSGSIKPHTVALATTLQNQHAGFLVNAGTGTDSGAPFIMLQISI